MTPFDHIQIELTGRNLIEASAGTGKTYAIACLYVRLLVEQGLTPEQILVVTFTEAATAELRGRIRLRIREALEVFAGAGTNDPFLLSLRDNANGRGPDRETAVRRLDRALRSFDLAAIHTIHGFCLRVLQDNAFESGSLYDTELVTDQTSILQELVDDFWRANFFGDNAPLLGYAIHSRCTPETLAKFLKQMLGSPKLRIVPDFTPEQVEELDGRLEALFASIAKLWREKRGEIEEILLTHKGLSRSADNYRVDVIEPLIPLMDEFARAGNPCDLFPGFEKFTASGVARAGLKKHPAPEHPIFDLCEELTIRVGERFLALKWSLVEYAKQRLPARKQELNVRCFDDLLTDLWRALGRDGGELLAENIRDRYRAALIDEFQDTDPVQYDIFLRIYTGNETPLFLIGDPKQAIYSFRGADIFAYLEAAGDVDEARRFTLDTNWRSAPRLLEAVNLIFENEKRPFVFDRISYHPVKPGKKELEGKLKLAGGDQAQFQVWFASAEDDGKPININTANDIIPEAVAAEIARLLRDGRMGGAAIDGRPVIPEDIAVIVRSHRQAGLVQEALRALGIPSVLRSSESLFATLEARETLTLLNALADPGNESRVKAALTTGLLGRNGDDIARLLDDEAAWEEHLFRFRDYHELWQERGFIVMSRLLTAREEVRGRLLGFPDGERRLTNFLHCLEILHNAGLEKRLGMEGLITWLRERIGEGAELEEYQLRLETDEKAVKIVTVHVSKGLEYPVVFCPFAWGGVREGDGVVTCHDGFATVKDFGSPELENHRALASREDLAENLRLLYVALTRAKFRCYLVGGRFKNAETSALAWLFHRPGGLDPAKSDLVERLKQEMNGVSGNDMLGQFSMLAGSSGGAIAVAELEGAGEAPLWTGAGDDQENIACKAFTGMIEHDWRVTSFTSFSSAGHKAVEHPDRDEAVTGEELPAPQVTESKGVDIFTFPRGAKAGTMLHEIFEKLDFAGRDEARVSTLVEEGLKRYGYDEKWKTPVLGMVRNVTGVQLPDGGAGFALNDLETKSWLPELEFFFPLPFLTSDRLRSALSPWIGGGFPADVAGMVKRLNFAPVKGVVHGFIDLVFWHGGRYYIIDWKSNWLGGRPEDYGRERLAQEMERKLYPLQYLLYTVAVNRFLALRQPGYDYDQHFGGVFYLFLRGMDQRSGDGYGIFADRPPKGMVEELTGVLVECGG